MIPVALAPPGPGWPGYNVRMQTYLVGGAVRDRLLEITPAERDWVVVGATPEELERRGYRRVGRQFPVYLHPDTAEEYALARTEVKTGPGYRGFEIDASPTVTLEEDLRRRDLTINAMAETADGRLIDPAGGRADLEAGLLRHVSDAFREDPVRILRVARFAARFAERGFRVAPDTRLLMREMVAAGEVDHLVPERVWQETRTALKEARPDVYFEVLRDCDALAVVFPEIDVLFGVPQKARWHPEIDTGVHVMMALRAAAQLGAGADARFAVLLHDLGKGLTAPEHWPSHHGHEARGIEVLRALCARLAVPNRYRDLALAVMRFHGLAHRADELRPGTLLELLEGTGALRDPARLDAFLLACEADARGRTGLEDREWPQAMYIRRARDAALGVDAAAIAASRDSQGPAVGEAIRQARIRAIGAANAGSH